jgi:amino acid adenylation domain-containing protein
MNIYSVTSRQVSKSKNIPTFSCFIVGGGAIAIRCLQTLLKAEQTVLGIFSTDVLVQSWAKEKGIPQSYSQSSFQKRLLEAQYDYLFSINNSWIIPEIVIKRATKATINYHDSPLPKYAGTHATSWALINGEMQHAITWHQVVSKIDAGDILKQIEVPIHSDDTAFSLNIRCFDAAITAFDQLVEELSGNQQNSFVQDLSQRSYFSENQRPEAACILSFQHSTKELYDLVRALDFGPIPNPLGLPKIWLPRGVVCIRQARIVDSYSGEPGQILAIDDNGLQIACLDSALLLSRMMTIEGVPLGATELIKNYGAQVGQILPYLSLEQRQIISHYNQSICRHERFWVDRLAQKVPFTHPYLQVEALTQKVNGEVHRYPIEWSRPQNQCSMTRQDDSDGLSLLTLFAAYCARLVTEAEFDLALQTNAQRSIAPELFAQSVPLRINCQSGESFTQFSERIKTECYRVSQRGNYARDIVARYPELQAASVNSLSVAVVLVSCPNDLNITNLTSEIVFVAYEDGSLPELIHTGVLSYLQSEAILQQLQCFITSCLQHPEQSLQSLPVLTEAERYQLLFEWNQTQSDYPDNKCIHQLFEEQVERTSDAIAVVFENQQITYRELNQRANQLAYYLQDLGVKTETLVGICVERSIEMLVGILGILKAGGAYVPLDPAYPQERLAFMLRDANVSVLVTQEHLIEKLPQHTAQVVLLDADWQAISRNFDSQPIATVKPNNLAYVIYTSGSTGAPKGVLIEHRSLVNYIYAVNKQYRITESDRILQFASLNFDIAAEEIYTCLTSGATLVLRTDSMLGSPKIFLQKCQEWKISVVNLPTAYWHELTAHLAVDKLQIPSSWRLVAIGGEPALLNRLQDWYQYVGNQVRLVNSYGPTEATVNTSIYDFSGARAKGKQEVLIGRPVDNTQIYILDGYLQPVPIGVAGELHIGGDGLARGYLNRPELTAEKFIPNPFSNEPGSRLYKTGDLARYLPDGNIEFLGRIDHQVKIRGFRIELGEIEAALTQHPDVQQAVVTVREDVPGDKRLVAYYVIQSETVSTRELREFVQQQLPQHMMPAAFVLLDALPLTSNGKVDRRALPAPDCTQRHQDDQFVAPHTPTELSIANIWKQVLGLQQVGIHDNFFELGGHSLLAVQIISRIRETFVVDLPLSCLFESSTIAGLSQAIASIQEGQIGDWATLPIIAPAPRNHPIPLSFSQADLWYFEHHTVQGCAGNSPLALKLTGTLSPQVLEQSLNEIVRRHEILRTTFPIVEGQPIQHILPASTVPVPVIDLQHLRPEHKEAEAEKIFLKEMSFRFDLTVAPPFKTILIKLTDEEHWLLILMHHIITDGWSCNILLEEMETLYGSFSANQPSPLPALPFQYADFAIWQRNHLTEDILATHLSYWEQHLANFPPSLDLLPAIQPPQANHAAPNYQTTLPAAFTPAISRFCQTHSVTPFMVLLTALNILLYQWSHQTDIVILGTMANRTIPEIEKLLGCFISDLPLRAQLDPNQTGISLLQQVKQTVSAALTHAIPPEKIWAPFKPFEDKIEVFRTVNFVLVPATRASNKSLTFDTLPLVADHDVWDENHAPLELYVSYPTEEGQAIEFAASYSTTEFTDATISRFISHYQDILQTLTEFPETLLCEFAAISRNANLSSC